MSAKERIIEAAYDLFSRQGTRAVGVDAIIERSGVAKMTLYRHFRSKQDLVLAFLERREQLWTAEWLTRQVRGRAADPKGRMLAVFDAFHEWFQHPQFEGCPFINVLLEYEQENKLHVAAAHHLAQIRALLRELAVEAGIPDAGTFAAAWYMLMTGAIIAASAGNRNAATEARRAAEVILKGWS
ncbi:MAG: TetR/AcrR family transcriptional regulator [Rhodospirillaceae bacterium]|jgi:AcrR family transcriptional regulator|nr:TetR/AcrR family transcriptional regulator [Rhodospirillaceae bacterium]